MKKITFPLLFIFLSQLAFSQLEFKKIGELIIDYNQLAKDYPLALNELYTSNRKVIGKFDCFKILDIIKPISDKLSEDDKKRLIIATVNSSGVAHLFTYYDIDPKYSPLPPMIVYKKGNKGSIGDTILIREKNGELQLDEALLEAKLIVQTQVSMQVKSITAAENAKFFTKPSLVVPLDKTTNRWLDDINKIEFYIMDNKK